MGYVWGSPGPLWHYCYPLARLPRLSQIMVLLRGMMLREVLVVYSECFGSCLSSAGQRATYIARRTHLRRGRATNINSSFSIYVWAHPKPLRLPTPETILNNYVKSFLGAAGRLYSNVSLQHVPSQPVASNVYQNRKRRAKWAEPLTRNMP